jgi:hypothetical protein
VSLENDLEHSFEYGLGRKRLRRDPLREIMGVHSQVLRKLFPAALHGLDALKKPRRNFRVRLAVVRHIISLPRLWRDPAYRFLFEKRALRAASFFLRQQI